MHCQSLFPLYRFLTAMSEGLSSTVGFRMERSCEDCCSSYSAGLYCVIRLDTTEWILAFDD